MPRPNDNTPQSPRQPRKPLAVALFTMLAVSIFALIALAPSTSLASPPPAPQPPAQNQIANLAPATIYRVNSLEDSDDGFCQSWTPTTDCTFREAIYAANAHTGADEIDFDVAGTITLVSTLPNISSSLTIDAKTLKVTLDGNFNRRLLVVNSGITLTVNHLGFKNGITFTTLTWGNSGGAIYNDGGTLNVLNSVFYDNSAGNYGGAILSDGTTVISNSTFVGNSAADLGGALMNVTGRTMTVLHSTFQMNSAPNGGAGIFNQGTINLRNNIIAASTGSDCTNIATISDKGGNVISQSGGFACGLVSGTNGDATGVNPGLGSLQDNGGPTLTVAIPSNSPAIDRTGTTACLLAPVANLDQRGNGRYNDGDGDGLLGCDSGAYEAPTQATRTPTATATQTPTHTLTPTQTLTPTPTSTPCFASKPTLLKPANKAVVTKARVKFDWTDTTCTYRYVLTVQNIATGETVQPILAESQGKVKLARGKYKWYVLACPFGQVCTKSKTFKFQY